MADANNNKDPAANYYSGRPLNYDPHQAQVVPTPPPPPPLQPQPAVGGQVNAPPAPQPPSPSPQDAGEQANHTQVHGVPGYYKGRVSKTKQSRAAAAPPAPAAAPPAAVEPRKELSFIEKLGGKDKK